MLHEAKSYWKDDIEENESQNLRRLVDEDLFKRKRTSDTAQGKLRRWT